MKEIVHQDASTKKRVLALLIDYFLLVIGNVIFYFLVVSQIANALPIMKDLSNAFYNSYNEVEEIIEESKLNTKKFRVTTSKETIRIIGAICEK